MTRNWRLDIPPEIGDALKSYEPQMFEDLVICHRYRRYWRVMSRIGSLSGWGSRLAYILELSERRLGTRSKFRRSRH